MKTHIHGHNLGQGPLQNISLKLGSNEVSIGLRQSHAEAFLAYWVRSWTRQWVEDRIRRFSFHPTSNLDMQKKAADNLLRCLSYPHRTTWQLANGLHALEDDLILLMPSNRSRCFKSSSAFIHDLKAWIDGQRSN